jgi:hypothetical protein
MHIAYIYDPLPGLPPRGKELDNCGIISPLGEIRKGVKIVK